MKTILILTDFTENAAHAALSGVIFGAKLLTNLLLFNVNANQPVVPQYAGGPAVIDDFNYWEKESKEKLNKLSESLEPLIVRSDDQHRKPGIHIQYVEGSVGEMVEEISKLKDIEMIVMGARAGSTIDHILTGSETISVIDHSTRPVLVVPLNVDLKKLRKVIFATDFNGADIKGVHYLVKLGRLFNFHLEIVHVNLYGEDSTLKKSKEEAFLKQINRLKYPNITFKEISGKDVIHRLNSLCDATAADMLSMMHYKNSFFMRILQQSTTHKALSNQKIPLLVFPSEMEER